MILYDKHRETIDKATQAIYERTFYAAYPEHPKAYAEDGMAKAQDWFESLLGNPYSELLQKNPDEFLGTEASPYTQELLNIKYPYFSCEKLIGNARTAMPEWRHAEPETRAGILVDSLERIK